MSLRRLVRRASLSCSLGLSAVIAARGQVSLQTAVDMALKNSPKVKIAQADLAKAVAARGEAKDAFIPVLVTTGGYGQATGAPLGVPVIFGFTAQSLVFSFSQKDYIRSAQAAVEAADHAVNRDGTEVVEDTTNTYIALDSATKRAAVLRQEIGFADQLVTITGERVSAGVDAGVELPRSRRTATQIRLLTLQVDDEVASDRRHLASLTGLPEAGLRTDDSSIPKAGQDAAANQAADSEADDEGTAAAFATARAKEFSAFGDRRYLLRPNVSLAANYSRIDTNLSSYAAYYPRFSGTATDPNSQNSLSFALQITVPLLDMAHRSKARGSAADARRAYAEAELDRGLFREGRAKLRNATAELELRAELARDDQEIAQAQLQALQLQLQADAGNLPGHQASPKDQLNAQLQERQRYLDVLNAEMQLRQTQVNLLRQNGNLSLWVRGTASAGSTQGAPLTPATNTLGVPGITTPGATPLPPVLPTPATPTTPQP